MKTRVTELLGIKHPIIQGAMSWVSWPELVAAVSNAGGLGILGAAFMRPDELRENIKKVKELTDKPFGVNFLPENPELDLLLDVMIDEKVKVASYGKGNPKKIIERTKPTGMINMPTMGAAKHAIKAEHDGADIVIVQGTEGGGHTGFVASSVLLPKVTEELNIPVVAAGGFADGRGLLAALALGAGGISMGTRFIVTKECPVGLPAKEWIIRSSEEDTVVTDNLTGFRARVLRNKFAESMLDMAEQKADPWEMMQHAKDRFRKAFQEGDLEWGSTGCGQVAGLIKDIPTCKELIERIVKEAEELVDVVRNKVLG
jgi:enoyl-[acyl-carrier protein] reductase II